MDGAWHLVVGVAAHDRDVASSCDEVVAGQGPGAEPTGLQTRPSRPRGLGVDEDDDWTAGFERVEDGVDVQAYSVSLHAVTAIFGTSDGSGVEIGESACVWRPPVGVAVHLDRPTGVGISIGIQRNHTNHELGFAVAG